jgi:sigma-B regulation protein RsbU (phosphoserine phosphatase)
MLKDIPRINEGETTIPSGSKLLCYTDGLVEMENENMVEFGTQEVEKFLVHEDNMDQAIWKIIQRLNIHKGRKVFFDDISMLGLKFF